MYIVNRPTPPDFKHEARAMSRPARYGRKGNRTMRCDVNAGRPDGESAGIAENGDEAAFDEVHRRNRALIYAAALETAGRAADAEDTCGARDRTFRGAA